MNYDDRPPHHETEPIFKSNHSLEYYLEILIYFAFWMFGFVVGATFT
jgi:hypothetical protein